MNFGDFFKQTFPTQIENIAHPHIDKEKAHLFSSPDLEATEVEVINFLNALAYCFKPSLVLETGTYRGYGTIAIASALKDNGFGKIVTIDNSKEHLMEARANAEKLKLSNIEYLHGMTLDVLGSYTGNAFDMAFFDSDLYSRPKEFNLLLQNGLLKENSICLFHDTSETRSLSYDKDKHASLQYIQFMKTLLQRYEGFCFPLSRGFHFFRLSKVKRLVSML